MIKFSATSNEKSWQCGPPCIVQWKYYFWNTTTKCRAESNHKVTSDTQTDERQCAELAVFWNASTIKDKDWD